MISLSDRSWVLVLLLMPTVFMGSVAAQESGLHFYGLVKSPPSRPRSGGTLHVLASVRNTGKEKASGTFVAKLSEQIGEEDRVPFELEPGTERTYAIPIRILPTTLGPRVEAAVSIRVTENGREVMIVGSGPDAITRTLKLDLDEDKVRTALLVGQEPEDQVYWRWPHKSDFMPYEAILASRIDLGLTRRCSHLMNGLFPIEINEWDGIDLVVIADPEPLKDATNIASIQHFLQTGGKVWVMLDEIDTELIEPLLSHGQACTTLDSCELHHYVVEVHDRVQFSEADRTVDLEKPVRFKRLVQQGGTVLFSIDGWPAAIRMPIGSGELVMTALEAPGWLLPRTQQRSPDPYYQSNYRYAMWANSFPHLLHAAKSERTLETSSPSYPLERIGNPILSRGLVIASLSGFCLFLFSSGLWLAAVGKLKSIGWIAPVLAMGASLPILVASLWQRKDLPPMVSTLQVVQLDGNAAFMRESCAVYGTQSREMELESRSDSVMLPAAEIETGVRRITKTGFGRWTMSNEAWPAGTWRYKTRIGIPEKYGVALATLDEDGLKVKVPSGLPSKLEDMVLSFSPGSPTLGVWNESSQSWEVDGSLPAEGDRWATTSLLSEEQLRRIAIYREAFDIAIKERQTPSRVLFGWTDLWPESPSWNPPLDRRGAALVSMPVTLSVPPVGSKIRLPHSVLQIEPAPGSSSSIYDVRFARWNTESGRPGSFELQVVLPPEVLPFQAESIEIDWDVRAPNRIARLSWNGENEGLEITKLIAPSIPWLGGTRDSKILNDCKDGHLMLKIEIIDGSDLVDQQKFIAWQIKHLRLSIIGRTLPRDSLVKPLP